MPMPQAQAAVQTPSTDVCINVAVTSLAIYEFIITIGHDVRIVWRRPVTISSVLLGSVRWCMLLTAALGLPSATPKDCPSVPLLDLALNIVGFAQTAVFSALRVFAVTNRSYLWSSIVLALSFVPVVTNTLLAAIPKYRYVVDSLGGGACISEMSSSMQATFGILLYVTRSSLVIADTMVLVATWKRTYSHWRYARGLNVRLPLTTCLLRDGTIYFVVLLASNIAHMLTYYKSAFIASPMVPFITVLPPVLINRFMINLRTLDSEMSDFSFEISNRQQKPPMLQMRVTNLLGNIGGTLDDGLTSPFEEELSINDSQVEEAHESSSSHSLESALRHSDEA